MRIAVLLLLAWQAFAETKVLKNFSLIDGTGKPVAQRMAMVVVDGRIQAIDAAAKIQTPAGAEVIDLAGKFVMPGIINVHGHVGSTFEMVQDGKVYTRENVERQLKTYASYGVTTMVSLGNDLDPVFAVRDAQRSGRPRSSRLYTGGSGILLKGGYPTPLGIRREVSSVAEAEAAVAEMAAKKVDFIKIWVDDHFGRERTLPIEFSRAIIRAAKQRNLRVAAHIMNLKDAKELVDAGIYALAHSVRDRDVDQPLLDAMKRNGTWQIATLSRELAQFVYTQSPKFLEDPFLLRSLSPTVIQAVKSPEYITERKMDPDFPKYAGILDTAKRNLKRAADAGVKIGLGTDSGPPGQFQGYFEHLEMELMANAGLTPAQIITIATRNGAEFLGAHDLGTLERGKWADLLVLSKNPIEDIRNTRALDAVYLAGNRVGP